jgi:hypothetical protein
MLSDLTTDMAAKASYFRTATNLLSAMNGDGTLFKNLIDTAPE